MRCLGCGGEMRLTNVAQADAMLVPGFEQRTLTCRECGDVEQRLVFSHRVARTEPPVQAAVQAPVEAPLAQLVEVPIATLSEAPIKMDLTHPVDSSPLSPPDPAPRAEPPIARTTWAQATERLQLRHAAKAQGTAQKKGQAIATETAETVIANAQPAVLAKPARELDDFDRLWESLGQPLPPPGPSVPAAAVPAHDEPVMRSSLIASAQHDMAFHDMAFHEKSSDERSHAPAEPSRLVTSGQDEVPSWRERSVPQPLASSTPSGSKRSITQEVFRNAWTRVAAVVRGKRDAASKPRHADAMLQIDAGPLKW